MTVQQLLQLSVWVPSARVHLCVHRVCACVCVCVLCVCMCVCAPCVRVCTVCVCVCVLARLRSPPAGGQECTALPHVHHPHGRYLPLRPEPLLVAPGAPDGKVGRVAPVPHSSSLGCNWSQHPNPTLWASPGVWGAELGGPRLQRSHLPADAPQQPPSSLSLPLRDHLALDPCLGPLGAPRRSGWLRRRVGEESWGQRTLRMGKVGAGPSGSKQSKGRVCKQPLAGGAMRGSGTPSWHLCTNSHIHIKQEAGG